jgi:hypothetical protein
MAETTQFTLEGEMRLAYFSGENDSRHILIDDNGGHDDGNPATVPTNERRLESYICEKLGFPNDAEYDEMFKKLDELRKQGLRPVEGVPDGVRENVRLRISVEVLSDSMPGLMM